MVVASINGAEMISYMYRENWTSTLISQNWNWNEFESKTQALELQNF